MSESPRSIVLVGPMGAGKSSIGKKLSKVLDRPFVDTDSVIAQQHGAISDIFAEHGEAYFRDLEREAVADALRSGAIVAVGGGAVLDEATRTALRDHDVVLLTVQRRIVASRLAAGGRPLLDGDEDPVARWARIKNERMPLYEEVADATFDTSTGRIQTVVEEIAIWARGRNA